MFKTLLALSLCSAAAHCAERKFDFGAFGENQSPTNFRSAVTGRGQLGEWKVVMEDVPMVVPPLSPKAPIVAKRPVLAQLSKYREEGRAPLFIYQGDSFNDFSFHTRFKIISGDIEQMAGVAFRLQDEKNYYYIRATPRIRTWPFSAMSRAS